MHTQVVEIGMRIGHASASLARPGSAAGSRRRTFAPSKSSVAWVLVAASLTACESGALIPDAYDSSDSGLDTDAQDTDVSPQLAIVAPDIVDWGQRRLGCPAETRTVLMTTATEAAVQGRGVRITGPTVFSVDAPPLPFSLGDDTSLAFDIGFSPNAASLFEGLLQITVADATTGAEQTIDVTLRGEGSADVPQVDRFVQGGSDPVDLLWVLDFSCSMGGVIGDLETHIGAFLTPLFDLGVDLRMGATTVDVDTAGVGNQGTLLGPVLATSNMTVTEMIQGFDAQVSPSASAAPTEKALAATYAALEDPGHAVDALIRDDAHLAIVVVGDEDDQSTLDVTAYITWLNAYKASPSVASVSGVIPKSGGAGQNPFDLPGCGGLGLARIGGVVNGTGGHTLDLCAIDTFADPDVPRFARAVVGHLDRFTLAVPPADAEVGMVVRVDGVLVPLAADPDATTGYTFDGQANAVVFRADSVPAPGAEIEVSYPPGEGCAP